MGTNAALQSDAEGADAQVEQASTPETPAGGSVEHTTKPAGQPAKTGQGAESAWPDDQRHQALKRILAAHTTWFDVHRDYEYAGRTFPGYAEFHSYGEKYVLVKRAKLWEVDAHEYIFFTVAESLGAQQVQDLVAFMETDALAKVNPGPNHMSSCLSLVMVADRIGEDVAKQVRKTRFRKNFAFSLRGWADLRLAAVDLSSKCVHTNAAGKQLKAMLEANAFPRPEA